MSTPEPTVEERLAHARLHSATPPAAVQPQHQAQSTPAERDQVVHQEDQTPVAPAPPPFQPIFTVITDSNGVTHHPRVCYLFEDDEPDVLLDHMRQQRDHPAEDDGTGASNQQHRTILLDLVPKQPATATGGSSSDALLAAANNTTSNVNNCEVAWASSLSPDWAVTSATLAPMNDTATADAASSTNTATNTTAPHQPTAAPERLMLRIEGTDLASTSTQASSNSNSVSNSNSSSSGAQQQGDEDNYKTLIEEFDTRMAVLRKVVDAGVERQAKIAAATASAGGPVDVYESNVLVELGLVHGGGASSSREERQQQQQQLQQIDADLGSFSGSRSRPSSGDLGGRALEG